MARSYPHRRRHQPDDQRPDTRSRSGQSHRRAESRTQAQRRADGLPPHGLLGEAGIFSITGPTGAGKSTILDAITLALFGKAARYEKEADTLIESLTGLDYHRFLCSVLLAQGRFKEFLDAGDNERGELLQKITGTEIYSRISQKAFEIASSHDKNIHSALRKRVSHHSRSSQTS